MPKNEIKPPSGAADISKTWRSYPTGPHLKTYLERVVGDHLDRRTGDDFSGFITDVFTASPPSAHDEAADLVDELVAMDLPNAALALAALCPFLSDSRDFRVPFALGVAAMLTAKLDRARQYFAWAHELAPAEPAPYVNLAMIGAQVGDQDAALDWCQRGLSGEPNHPKLWEILGAQWVQTFGEDEAARRLSALSSTLGSWSGASLAASLVPSADPRDRTNLLLPFYERGERSDDFLVELTAGLGIAGEYDRLLAVIAEAEERRGRGAELPWQLHVHAAQALVGLSSAANLAAADSRLARALADPNLPPNAKAALASFAEEITLSPK